MWPAAFQVALDVAAWYFEEIFQHFEENKRKNWKSLASLLNVVVVYLSANS